MVNTGTARSHTVKNIPWKYVMYIPGEPTNGNRRGGGLLM